MGKKKHAGKGKGKRKLHKLSPEQKAKRKARFKKLVKVFAWMNPVGATIMAHKLIAEKVKARRAAKKASQQETAIVDDLVNSIGTLATNAESQQPAGGAQADYTMDDVSNNLSEQYDDSADEEYSGADGFGADGFMNADGDMTPAVKAAFDTAKKKANALTGTAKTEALATIAELESSITKQTAEAKKEVAAADKNDVTQVKAALKGVHMGKLAKSATSTTVEAVGKPDKAETVATGTLSASMDIPAWVYYTGGALLISALAYGAYTWYKNKE